MHVGEVVSARRGARRMEPAGRVVADGVDERPELHSIGARHRVISSDRAWTRFAAGPSARPAGPLACLRTLLSASGPVRASLAFGWRWRVDYGAAPRAELSRLCVQAGHDRGLVGDRGTAQPEYVRRTGLLVGGGRLGPRRREARPEGDTDHDGGGATSKRHRVSPITVRPPLPCRQGSLGATVGGSASLLHGIDRWPARGPIASAPGQSRHRPLSLASPPQSSRAADLDRSARQAVDRVAAAMRRTGPFSRDHGITMRAEPLALVEQIKQSVGLLRRHL